MKKLFSIVLVAAGMFMSANAKEYNVSNWAGLQSALDEVIANGGDNTITLGNDITIPGTYNILYGTNPEECKSMYGAKLVINLNGHNLNNNGYSGPVFNVFNGTLEFAGNGAVESNTSEVISIRGYADNKMSSKGTGLYLIPEHNIFWNAGEGPKDYSQLIVGQNVTLHMTKPGKEGGEKVIYVDGVRPDGKTEVDKTTKYSTNNDTKKIYFFGAPNIPYQTAYASKEARTEVNPSGGFYGMGINIIINGSILSEGNRCIQINGSNKECQLDADGNEITEKRNVPVITINSTAKLHASDTLIYTGTKTDPAAQAADVTKWESCPAIYAGGYAEWHIYGEVIGQVGIYAKSGDFDIKDAHIESNSKTDYAKPEFKGSGSKGGDGCGIVFDNNGNYAQAMTVTISGNTEVIGSTGYAIQETTTKGGDKIVVSGGEFTIEGGTFKGGDKGCLEVEADLGAHVKAEGSITAGSFSDPEVLLELLDDIHGSIAVQTEDGKTTYVVTPAGTSVSDPNTGDKNTLVEMTTATSLAIATGTVENKYLKMQNGAQLTVKAGARYIVGGMAIDEASKIIVEPGAELVINEDGITAFSTSNIVLQANATQQASLLMNPAVTGNTKPYAEFMMLTNVGKDGAQQYYERFGVPMDKITGLGKSVNVTLQMIPWDYNTNAWAAAPVSSLAVLKPFVGYAVTHPSAKQEVTFTFKGQLCGNNNYNVVSNAGADGWNYLSNAYTGKANVKQILSGLDETKLSATLYLWNATQQMYEDVTLTDVKNGHVYEYQENINPFQTIIFQSMAAGADVSFNYKDAVWDPAMSLVTTAPARANDNNHATITITATNGQYDRISLTEAAEFDNEFNNGADANKFMNENHINAYAMVNGEKQSAVATNNIEGTMISLETVEGAEYTMSFSHVNGEPMAILDVLTGAVINMEEGNVYNFVANENAVNAGRFQVRKVAEVATNVENAAVQNDIVKTIVNDQVVIIRNGVRYNTVGQRL